MTCTDVSPDLIRIPAPQLLAVSQAVSVCRQTSTFVSWVYSKEYVGNTRRALLEASSALGRGLVAQTPGTGQPLKLVS